LTCPRTPRNPEEFLGLTTIPGIGPKLAQMLVEVGIRRVGDLVGKDPEEMYLELCGLKGPVDRCVLYAFRCAVYFAEHPGVEPSSLKWWDFKDN